MGHAVIEDQGSRILGHAPTLYREPPTRLSAKMADMDKTKFEQGTAVERRGPG